MPDSSADYDALPYEGHPDPMIHPDRMATAAWLHGLEAPRLESARILEIGCATGAHLLPIACQFPGATCVGLDYSPKQIEMARAAAAGTGLNNVSFEVRDIRDDGAGLGEFDYIFAHGIFSWVPRAVQEALLQMCRRHLSPTGVALVDYNVYPGWHLRGFLGDLLAFHKQGQSDLASATSAALSSLDFVASHMFVPSGPFAQATIQLQRWAAGQSKNYLAHEFGSSAGHPVMFTEFAERSQCHGLKILGDAEIVSVIPVSMAAAVGAKLNEVGGADETRREQYLDFLRGREFRRTLLVREDANPHPQIQFEAVRRLRFSTIARCEPLPQGAIFRCPDGTMLQSVNAPLIRAMHALCDRGAAGMSFDEMHTIACQGTGAPTLEIFAASLLEAVAGGFVQPHAHRPRVVNSVSSKPVANPVARAAVGAGRPFVASMLQRDWQVDPFECHLIALLDGTRDRDGLARELQDAGGPDPLPNIPARVTSALNWFARVGILVG